MSRREILESNGIEMNVSPLKKTRTLKRGETSITINYNYLISLPEVEKMLKANSFNWR